MTYLKNVLFNLQTLSLEDLRVEEQVEEELGSLCLFDEAVKSHLLVLGIMKSVGLWFGDLH